MPTDEKEAAWAKVVDEARPLREWDQTVAFDSALECEDFLTGLIKRADAGTLSRVQTSHSRCISVADPRLTPKATR
jgi:hypothetical protein